MIEAEWAEVAGPTQAPRETGRRAAEGGHSPPPRVAAEVSAGDCAQRLQQKVKWKHMLEKLWLIMAEVKQK